MSELPTHTLTRIRKERGMSALIAIKSWLTRLDNGRYVYIKPGDEAHKSLANGYQYLDEGLVQELDRALALRRRKMARRKARNAKPYLETGGTYLSSLRLNRLRKSYLELVHPDRTDLITMLESDIARGEERDYIFRLGRSRKRGRMKC